MTKQHNIFNRRLGALFLASLICALLLTPISASASNSGEPSHEVVKANTLHELQAIFQELDYDWKRLDRGVPSFILTGFPQDIGQGNDITLKKEAFFMGLLPMVLISNEEIAQQRATAMRLFKLQQQRTLSSAEKSTLAQLAASYKVKGNVLNEPDKQAELIKRMDIIPPSLVLAQAANESAWGSSRFARLGNNLFGEWTFTPGTGIVPKGRPPGANYEVRKFSSIYASIKSYMKNLNTNAAYRELRSIRADLRKANKEIDGLSLAFGLKRYSQRGGAYINEIQSMIRQNSLHNLNAVILREKVSETVVSVAINGSGFFSTRLRAVTALQGE